MILTRRKFLTSSSLYFCLNNTTLAKSLIQKKDSEWETYCKAWIIILISDGNKNSATHSKEIWKQIQQLMAGSRKTEAKIKQGFALLKKQPLPTNNRQLNIILQQRSNTGLFLHYFFNIVLEAYYGSQTGWDDLSLYSTPQPNGFNIIK